MGHKRNIYLKMKTLAEARRVLQETFPAAALLCRDTEMLSVPDSVGRVLAEPVFARLSSPNFHAAAMDGLAVAAECTYGASETTPLTLTMGRDVFPVNTGHVLPEGTDAVIMIEHVTFEDPDRAVIEAPVFPWQNVRKMGEDIVAGELLFPQNHLVTPYCVGALLSGGIFLVAVRRKPRVLIIPTGSELVDWRTTPLEELKPGQVLESNGYVLSRMVEAVGGEAVQIDKRSDDLQDITAAVAEGVAGEFDLVLTIGGSSAGSEDFARHALSELGNILIHGVTIMPGKPVIAGEVSGKPVFGMPGYPVSAIVAFEQLVRPLLCAMLGQPEPEPQKVQAHPTRKIPSKLGVEEFLRVKLGQVGERIVTTPLPRGAGMITSITEADGILRIPNQVEGVAEHEPVMVELLKPLPLVKNTIVVVGSHDNTLDLLADQLQAAYPALSLSSSHVGSMGGLMAIRKGVCHMAGSHLLDTEDGTYNASYIRKYLPGIAVRRVNLVFRDQGLIVLPGNPKNIRGIEDLVRDDVRLINRQGGSGTRILLDYRLEQLGIDAGDIEGYRDEEFTHMSVAVAVLSGRADVGLGIYAAARALGLDFIPVVTEQYDLIIPEDYFDTENIQRVLEIINSRTFKAQVEALGGYHTEKTGELY